MKRLFSPNIGTRGRLLRGVIALALLIGCVLASRHSIALAIVLAGSSLFVAFEALRGWCALRACGIKTKF